MNLFPLLPLRIIAVFPGRALSLPLLGIALASCQAPPPDAPPAAGSPIMEVAGLVGTQWRLVELVSMEDSIGTIRPQAAARYTMVLGADGRAQFELDCNRANGPWNGAVTANSGSPASGALSFGAMAMTRALCPEGSLDTRIARELPYVRSFVIEGRRITLSLMADGGLQVWEAAN